MGIGHGYVWVLYQIPTWAMSEKIEAVHSLINLHIFLLDVINTWIIKICTIPRKKGQDKSWLSHQAPNQWNHPSC